MLTAEPDGSLKGPAVEGQGSLVRFPAFRDYEEARQRANDAMMVLLVSSRLAAHTLELHTGSTVLLPEIFPAVPEVARMNRTVSAVRDLVADAERDLAYMAIPYVLSIHQAFVSDAMVLFRERTGEGGRDDPQRIDLDRLHERFAEETGADLPERELEVFHCVRRVRNRILHNRATTGSHLRSAYRTMNAASRDLWERLAERPLTMTGDQKRLQLGFGELKATLAVTKRLSRAVNRTLQGAVARDAWADTVVADFMVTHDPGNPSNRSRRVGGYARHMYGVLELTETELSAALQRASNSGQ